MSESTPTTVPPQRGHGSPADAPAEAPRADSVPTLIFTERGGRQLHLERLRGSPLLGGQPDPEQCRQLRGHWHQRVQPL